MHIRRLSFLGISLLTTTLTGDPIDLLRNDWDSVLRESLSSGRHIYLAFTGEGWSVQSKRFKENVLQTPAFESFAKQHLVDGRAVSRRKPKLSKEEIAHLQALVIHFDIQSWPTFILCAPDGSEIIRHGYKDLNGQEYVLLLKTLLELDTTASSEKLQADPKPN
jgi:thioredoxin-related protein